MTATTITPPPRPGTVSASSEHSPHHRRDLQGLRGIAILITVAYHLDSWVIGGFIAVDVFFVLSGFVITAALLRELRGTGTIRLATFYTRRVRRLLPALALVVLFTLATSMWALDPAGARQDVTESARAASLFFANIHLDSVGEDYFAPAAELNPLLHAWSLSIEEQFYAVLPLLMLTVWAAGRRAGTPERWLPRVIAALTGVSFLAATWVVVSGDERAAFYFPHLRAWEFGVGVLLAFAATRLETIPGRAGQVMSGVGLAVIVACSFTISGSMLFPGPLALVPVVATVLVIAGGASGGGATSGLGSRWLVWLGDRSYSWYLWHWPVLTFAFITWPHISWVRWAGAAAALAPAVASYAWIEDPIRRNRRIVGPAAAALAAAVIIVPVLVSVAVEADADREIVGRAPELTNQTALWDSVCGELPWDEEQCTFGPEDFTGTVALVGDSHAAAYGTVVTQVASSLNMRTVAFSHHGCPVALGDGDVGFSGGSGACDVWLTETLDTVDSLDVDVVVVAQRSALHALGGPGSGGADPSMLASWADGVELVLDRVDAPVVVIQSAPEQPGRVVDLIGADVTSADVPAMPVQDHEATVGLLNTVERDVFADRADVSVFDPASVLCSDVCPAHVAGKWRYLDGNHLTVQATFLFSADLERLVRDATAPR